MFSDHKKKLIITAQHIKPLQELAKNWTGDSVAEWFAQRRPRLQVLPWSLAGIVYGYPDFRSSTNLRELPPVSCRY